MTGRFIKIKDPIQYDHYYENDHYPFDLPAPLDPRPRKIGRPICMVPTNVRPPWQTPGYATDF